MTMSLFAWAATAVLAGWNFFKQAGTPKNFQAAAACVWIICGVDIGAVPLVVANLVGGVAALCSSFRRRSGWKDEWSARIKAGNGGSSRCQMRADVGLK
jgi:hypothetical protein